MARVRRSYRFEESLALRFEAEARRLGQTGTLFVERALEKALGSSESTRPSEETSSAGRSTPPPSRASANFGAVAKDWKERPLEVPEELAEAVSKGLRKFKCGCATSATSPAAKCPQHGRSLA